jgi:hypothetical protein
LLTKLARRDNEIIFYKGLPTVQAQEDHVGKDGGFSEVKLAAELERIDKELDGDRTDTNSEVSVAQECNPMIIIWLCSVVYCLMEAGVWRMSV